MARLNEEYESDGMEGLLEDMQSQDEVLPYQFEPLRLLRVPAQVEVAGEVAGETAVPDIRVGNTDY